MEHSATHVLCPYCGHLQAPSDRCEVCRGLFEPLSRCATQIAMGPWYIRDPNNPFRPGCSYDVLVKQVEAGKIKATSILRGPTTRQFWSVARNVPGVAHLLGYCHSCGKHVEPGAKSCPSCDVPFRVSAQRNELGLQFETAADADAAQRQLDQDIQQKQAELAAAEPEQETVSLRPQGERRRRGETSAPQTDLLSEVISSATVPASGQTREKRSGASRLLSVRQTDAESAGKPARPETLDFGPSAERRSKSVDLPTSLGRGSLATWLLIGANVLLLLLIALFILSKGRPAPAPTSDGVPSNVAPAPSPPVQPVAPSTPPPAPAPAPVEPAPVEQPTSATQPMPLQAIGDAMEQARKLEGQGKLQEAIELLKKAEDRADPEQRPVGLETYIHRLEERLTHRKTATFFGIPIE